MRLDTHIAPKVVAAIGRTRSATRLAVAKHLRRILPEAAAIRSPSAADRGSGQIADPPLGRSAGELAGMLLGPAAGAANTGDRPTRPAIGAAS